MVTVSRLIPLLGLLLIIGGCAQTPHIYTMQPSELERIRAEITTLGVTISPELPTTKILLPAKGMWGGFKRGMVLGATMSVKIGVVAPIPGTSLLGVLFSPLGALIGGVYGVFNTVPAAEVEHAESILEIATEKIRQAGLRETFIQTVIDMGNAVTDLNFVAWPESQVSPRPPGMVPEFHPPLAPVDARLQIRAEKTGLRGMSNLDPPTDTFLQIHVQLVRLQDDAILLDERFTCASDEERTYKDWADQDGADMIDEFRECVPELAEKIVDDFFRVYPMEWKHGPVF